MTHVPALSPALSCSGPGVDDLFRAFLIPPVSPPVELFINVPDAELEAFPHVPSVQALCGSNFVALGDLVLFGAPFEFIGDCARDDRNTHLAPLLKRLEPVGSYLLVHRDGVLPESTTSTVLSALTFTQEWEAAHEDEFLEKLAFCTKKYAVDDEIEPFEPTAPAASTVALTSTAPTVPVANIKEVRRLMLCKQHLERVQRCAQDLRTEGPYGRGDKVKALISSLLDYAALYNKIDTISRSLCMDYKTLCAQFPIITAIEAAHPHCQRLLPDRNWARFKRVSECLAQ
jgi:hypothetical protein